MSQQYYHLRLVRWPFPIVPKRELCTFIADRQEFRSDLEALLTALARRDTSSIYLLWAWFGAGKTHSLFYLANRSAELGKHKANFRLLPVYSEFPRATRGYLDLYKSFMANVNYDALADAFLEVSTCADSNRLRRDLQLASPDLANALQAITTGTEDDRLSAIRWIRAESLPIAAFRKVGISQKVSSPEEAIRILSALTHLLNTAAQCEGRPGCRIIWMLDEFQRIEGCPARVRDEINTGLHSSFNACPTGLSIFLSFSNKPSPDGLPDWFSAELLDRIGQTKVMVLPPMLPQDALRFVGDLLAQHRVPEYANQAPFFPFAEDTCKAIIDEIRKKDDLKPRSIMHAFNAVLQEADREIEAGRIQTITPDYAREILAGYTVFKEAEES